MSIDESFIKEYFFILNKIQFACHLYLAVALTVYLYVYVETIEQSPLYAYIAPNGTHITDFVYEHTGDFSDGIAACSKDGEAWGYIDDMGDPIIDFIYEPAWDTPDGRAFPCTDSTIVAVKDGQYGLLYRDGSTLIDFGEFEALAPSWNNQLWAKKDGLWGLVDLADAKEQAGFPML